MPCHEQQCSTSPDKAGFRVCGKCFRIGGLGVIALGCLNKPNVYNLSHAAGAEETRDELRKQVYDAMAEKEKAEAGVPESEAGKGAAKSPGKSDLSGAEKPPTSPAGVKEQGSVEPVKMDEAEKSPEEDAAGEEAAPKEQTGDKTEEKAQEGKDEETEQQESAEGSKSLERRAQGVGCGHFFV